MKNHRRLNQGGSWEWREPWEGSWDLVLLYYPGLSFSIYNMGELSGPDLLKFTEVSRDFLGGTEARPREA